MENLPAQNQSKECRLSLQEREARADHREWIGGRALTLLNHYWREDDPVEMTSAIGADWADVLEGLPRDAIQRACIQYQRDEPRKKPTPGAIYQIAMQMMPKPKAVEARPMSADERKALEQQLAQARKIDPARAAKAREILGEFGFARKMPGQND